jgi:transposase-like protein
LKTEHASLTQAALHFNLSEPSTIHQWQRIFETEGVEALFRSRGRDPIMTGDKQTKREKSLSELEKLKEENELLRIENEYLKKLKALVHDHQKPKPKSSRN